LKAAEQREIDRVVTFVRRDRRQNYHESDSDDDLVEEGDETGDTETGKNLGEIEHPYSDTCFFLSCVVVLIVVNNLLFWQYITTTTDIRPQ
jgi:hypothetical protein